MGESGGYDIAVTGYACRLPGAPDARAFLDLLRAGRCTVTDIGRDRFDPGPFWDPDPAQRGKSYSFAAGRIDRVWDFDPGFFGLSPREAAQMDPQQRLIVEVAWEALEHAGLRPSDLAGERVGVFVGAASSDYSNFFFMDLARIDAQFMTGNTLSIISNRISYFLNLRGPSFTVDTACSSSFYALHEACRMLMAGEIETALVGGVNLLLSPAAFVGFSRASMLSPSGLCRAFDRRADGYVRAEGAVVFVLRRLAAARRDGDRVRGILAASGINSDGRTTGMALPSVQRQADLLRRMRERFAIDPEDLAFLEAHGTGTPVGDPVEAEAVGSVLGRARSRPLPIGSVKSNIGHLEPASGLAGLLKAQLALETGSLPATLHLEEPNPNIDFAGLNLAPAAEPVPIPARDRPWAAAVNNFGFGGANAHVVIRQPRADELAPAGPDPAPRALVLSAASAESLQRLAAAWGERLAAAAPAEVPALLNAAAWRREPLGHRLVALSGEAEELRAILAEHAAGRRHRALVTGRSPRSAGRTAFVFSGNGSQWAGMGRHLHETDPAFRARFDEVAALFAELGAEDLHALIAAEDLEARLAAATVAQPVLFAVQMALVAALAAGGLRPDAVAGHSVGEVAAAAAAGIVPLRDAVRLVHTRSVALDTLRGAGGMAAISAGPEEVARALEESGLTGIALAGVNSPRSVTLSGDADRLRAFLAWLRRNRRTAGVMLDVAIPYHSPAVEPLRRRLLDDLKGLRPAPGAVAFVSSTTGRPAHGLSLDAEYWWRNARDVVRFSEAVEALAEAGCQTFVEISPRPVLAAYVKDTLRHLGRSGHVVRTMDQGPGAAASAAAMVALAHAEGARIDPAPLFGPRARLAADLPAYPWANAPYRAEPTPEAADNWGLADWHPLLGRAAFPGQGVWRGDVNARSLPWLADHRVDGAVVLPAAAYVEIALAAGTRALGRATVELSDLEILRPLVLEEGGSAELRTTLDAATGALRIEARPRLSEADWALHAFGTVRAAPSAQLAAVEPPGPGRSLSAEALYAALARHGLAYGPAFRRAGEVTSAGNRAAAAILPAPVAPDPRLVLDPAALDAGLHAVLALVLSGREAGAREGDSTLLPVRIGRLRLAEAGAAVAGARVEVTRTTPRGLEVTIVLLDAAGRTVAAAEGLRLQEARLRGRSSRETLHWRQRLVRLRPADREVQLPKGWAQAPTRLLALGVAAPEDPEPDADAILADAVCRRLAWDVCLDLAGPSRRVDPELLPVGPAGRPVLERLLAALDEDGLLLRDPEGTRIAETCPLPEADALFARHAELAADRAQDLLELARIEAALPALLRDGPGSETSAAGADRSAASRAVWRAMGRLAADLAGKWRDDERLDILVLGAPPPDLVASLAAQRGIDRIVLSSVSARAVEMLGRTLPAHPAVRVMPLDQALAPLAFDVVLVAGELAQFGEEGAARLADALALGGLLVAIEAVPGLAAALSALVRGRMPESGARPRGVEGWAGLLGPSFRDLSVQPLASGAVEAEVIAARPRLRALRARGPVPGEGEKRAVVLVVGDRRPASLHLASLVEASLATAGMEVIRCTAAEELAGLAAAGDVIHLAHLPEAEDEPVAAVSARIATLRTILAAERRPERVWVVTRGGRAADAGPGAGRNPAEAALRGAVRVLANEHPASRFHAVDFAPDTEPELLAENLCSLVVSGTEEPEIVCRGREFLATRVEPAPAPDAGGTGDALRLEVAQQGALDSLAWQRTARRPPEPREVEIEVRAAGLNFRDLMWAQGLLPEEALQDGFAGATLGMECAGIIVRAGRESGRRRGEEVVAFAPASLATHVTVPAASVAALPSRAGFEGAATVPTVFVTALYALGTLARLRAGETLLVHGGAGGVGLAALQVARRIGARVLATAGTPAKRALLLRLGAAAAFDSRSLAFADEVRAATGGRGVDVVLNSLAGEAMERSLACLAPFGRFVELGKRDFFANTRLGLRPFRRNLSYFGVDADQLLGERPDLAERLLAEIAEGFASGAYAALPSQVFEAAEAVDAFRWMQQSRHVGKIVIRPPAPPEPQPRREPRPLRGAWLVTGGTGGFGLATAARLAERGASALWLASRSGQPRPEDRPALEALRALGVPVHLRAADVAERAALARVIDEIGAGDVPLRGVIHAAMVLDDGLSAGLDQARIAAVLRPKVAGAEHLDALTRDLDLDHFVLYSSVTTLFGNPGQLAYVAANSHLESLAARRRDLGLPGLAIAWGPIADRGYLQRDARTRGLLGRRLGNRMLSAEEALDALEALLAAGPAVPASLAVAPMRWRLIADDLPLLRQRLFDRVDLGGQGGLAEGAAGLLAMIEGLSEEEAVRKVTEALIAETSRILRQPAADIDAYAPLTELGFDSLMAMDLKLAAEEALGVTIPLLSIGDGMTLAQLSRRVVAQIRGAGATATGDAEGDRIVTMHLGDGGAGVDEDIIRRVADRAGEARR